MASTHLLEMIDIEKQYNGVPVLRKVNFNLNGGEVHALVGENGAGKSTLIKILVGLVKKNGGKILLNGEEIENTSPHEAAGRGITAVFQELSQVPTLTVAENVFLGKEPTHGRIMTDKKTMSKETKKILNDYGINLEPNVKVGRLSMAKRQIAETVKAIAVTPKILIMDEPTSTLSKAEADSLFDVVARLKSEGTSIIYISHRMDEIFRIADRITVLRDGLSVLSDDIANMTFDKVVSAMVGREIKQEDYASKRSVDLSEEDVVLEVKDIADGKWFNGVSFQLRKGEVLGFAGLVGSGRTELLQLVFGLRKYTRGEIILEGESLKKLTVSKAVSKGIGMVPESRQLQGIVAMHSIEDNIALTVLKELTHRGSVSTREKKKLAKEMIERLRIKCEGGRMRLRQLSGGNQQKVVIAKWLAIKPKILILDEPTAGIDVQAKDEVHKLIRKLVEQGISVILISSEMPELLNNSDRIIVMNDFRIIGEFKETTQEEIMGLIVSDKMKTKEVC